MIKVQTSGRALAAALGPFAVLHLVTLALIPPGEHARFGTPDAALGALGVRLGADAIVFGALHLGLRALGWGGRGAYAAIGAAAGAASYWLGLWTGWWPRFAPEGALVTAAAAPLLTGAVAGFMYHVFAGFDWGSAASGRRSGGLPGPGRAPIPTFSGPVQVRTSLGAFAVVTLAPPLLFALLTILFSFGHLSPTGRLPGGIGLRTGLGGLAVPLTVMLTGLACFSLPALVLVSSSHALARAWNRVDIRAYALIGFGCAAILPLLLVGRGAPAAAVLFGLLGAGAAALYRRVAGLEPKALPEHLVVRDRETLVPADHPARREHRVVFDG